MTFTWTRTLLRCTACGASWETPKDEPHECAVMAARSQADALAEALEPFACAYEQIGFLHCPSFSGPDDLQHFEEARSALASYRSSSSTETEG